VTEMGYEDLVSTVTVPIAPPAGASLRAPSVRSATRRRAALSTMALAHMIVGRTGIADAIS